MNEVTEGIAEAFVEEHMDDVKELEGLLGQVANMEREEEDKTREEVLDKFKSFDKVIKAKAKELPL
eukprot:CAMPEP_0201509320 /NCGR_PEP_ID=MMETSP0161_2-20130828/2416_1 /ASSEMBLY_ACC=CAM_ASM_000251 /TAXON_ID=180227 /ORGANISM="Neoparamoeba aestuarina, Strain SoJaBio B1-5/56/2" /LENGTH=65 /DNA_ID=CAMNT_0047904243 /DNA_START=444 /DNA_END=637 /DNA_ORIENTATION=+